MSNGNYYYWRVSARNAANQQGPFSAISEVGCDTQVPGAFNLVSPADNTDPGTKTPTFRWNASVDP